MPAAVCRLPLGAGAALSTPLTHRSIPKYRRYEKRHKNLAAHCSPAFRVEQGDQVTVGECDSATVRLRPGSGSGSKPDSRRISLRSCRFADPYPGQCRPLSKTVRFNVLRVSKNKAAAKAFQKF
jgi:small subunit ribosomal protein S11e